MLKKIIKASVVLASGTIGGQLFVLGASPFLTRLYSPADFGVFGVYAAILYILSAFAALRYEVSIPLIEKDRDAQCLAGAAIMVVIVFSISVFLSLLLFNSIVTQTEWRLFQWVLPLGILLAGIYNVLMYYQLRQGNYSVIAKVRASQAIGGASFQIGAGVFGAGPLGLILGQIIGLSGGGTIMGGRNALKGFANSFSFRRAKLLLRRQIDFAKFGAPAAFLQIANSHCITLVSGVLLSPASAGIYALVQRISITPFAIISAAISASLISLGKELKETGGGRSSPIQSLLVAIMCPVALAAAVILYFSFERIFGPQWVGGARISAWIVLLVSQKFIFDSLFSLTTATGQQKKGLKMQLMVFVTRHVAFFVPSLFFDFEIAVISFSIASTAVYFFATKKILLFEGIKVSRWRDVSMAVSLVLPYLIVGGLLYELDSRCFFPLCLFSVFWYVSNAIAVFRKIKSKSAAEK